jgi:tRNA (guanosine-2'-O-)-methyltransferase
VHIAIERPYDIHNGLAVVRTAEALGVHHIHFIDAQMKKGQGKGTTKGTLKWIHLHKHPSLEVFLQQKGTNVLVGAAVDGSIPLSEIPIDQPVCFLFGNEKEGVSKEAQERCERLFYVPMFGMVESYNLSVAAAMTLYDYVTRKRAISGKEGELEGEDLLKEKARYYVRSIGIEQSLEIIKRYIET